VEWYVCVVPATEVDGMEVLSSRTIIHPRDLERSLAFYGEALGLPVAREFGDGDGRGVVFFAGGGLVEVVGSARERVPSPAEGDGVTGSGGADLALWLQVRDIAATLADLGSKGVTITRAAVQEPWGLVEAWIDDPDGLRIHLVEVPADHPLRRDVRRNLGG
jgi:catechol 2,3-dioxygenase-like lactoylglutathione lyase family enzyme